MQCWAQDFPNQRLHFTCSVPLGCQEPGERPRVEGTMQQVLGEAAEGILLRATADRDPAGWCCLQTKPQLPSARNPCCQAEGRVSGVDGCPLSIETLCLQLRSVPLKLPHELREEFQRQLVFQRLTLEEKEQ